MAARARRNEFIDRRVDRCVFAPDTCPGKKSEDHEAPQIPGERGEHGRDEVDQQRDHEPFFSPLPVREIRKDEGAGHRAGQIRRGRQTHLRFGQPQRRRVRQHRTKRADNRHLKPIENPGDPQRRHDQPVPSRPRETIHALRNIRMDGGGGSGHANWF